MHRAFEPLERRATFGRTQSAVEQDDRDAAAFERAFLGYEGNDWRDRSAPVGRLLRQGRH